MELKTCPTCKGAKLYTDFNKRISTKDGLRSQCKDCERKRSKRYAVKNANKIEAYLIQYRNNNRDIINQNAREYGKSERGKLKNRKKHCKRRDLLNVNTPVGKDWTIEDIILKLKLQKYKCVYCETSIKRYYEIDHFIPLSKGGSNEASNIQLLCEKCNGSSGKWNKLPHEFALKYGKLI